MHMHQHRAFGGDSLWTALPLFCSAGHNVQISSPIQEGNWEIIEDRFKVSEAIAKTVKS